MLLCHNIFILILSYFSLKVNISKLSDINRGGLLLLIKTQNTTFKCRANIAKLLLFFSLIIFLFPGCQGNQVGSCWVLKPATKQYKQKQLHIPTASSLLPSDSIAQKGGMVHSNAQYLVDLYKNHGTVQILSPSFNHVPGQLVSRARASQSPFPKFDPQSHLRVIQ